jgi:hypothetical protein
MAAEEFGVTKSGWVSEARAALFAAKSKAPGWGYGPKAAPAVEPTVLCCLGLLATEEDGAGDHATVESCAEWLATVQRPDGSLGASAETSSPGWPTGYGILLWCALGTHETNRARAVAWLLEQRGRASAKDPQLTVGHDPSIVGWPWAAGTHSWLEPTALAILALRRASQGHHARVTEGLRLIRDRAIPGGGWNYGNTTAFGQVLRPQPAPTGLALLALASTRERSTAVNAACAYLERALPRIRAAQSLCWGTLGLAAWGRRAAEAERWIEEGYAKAVKHPGAHSPIAYALLGAGQRALAVLGVGTEHGSSAG